MKRAIGSLMMVGFVGALSIAGCSGNPVNGAGGAGGVAAGGSGGSSDADNWKSSPLYAYALAEAKWTCELHIACCDMAEIAAKPWYYATQAQCEQWLTDTISSNLWNDVKPAIDAGRLVYNADAGAECLAKFAKDCNSFRSNPFENDPVCRNILAGKVADADECAIDSECIGEHSICESAADSQLGGKCRSRPMEGDSCVDHNCIDGLFCQWEGVSPICTTLTMVGGACTTDFECASGYCPFGTKTCTATFAAGTACTDPLQCTSGMCDSVTNTCAPEEAVLWQCDGK